MAAALQSADRQHQAKGQRLGGELLLLVAITAAGAALRFSTLGLQSLWYDEAFGAVHLFNGSFGHLLHQLPRTENTPPLWYVLEWLVVQALGRGAVALRLLSALAGTALIPVSWAIGRELAGRRAGAVTAALVAANPLFFWYSQEARAYSLYVLLLAVAFLAFLRAERAATVGRAVAFGLLADLALLSHYFAAFLVVPMAIYLLRRRERRASQLPALSLIGLCGAALLPLAIAQGGKGAEWIARSSLLGRIEAIPQYLLTGYSGAPLGHSVELAVAAPLLVGALLGAAGAWRRGRSLAPVGMTLGVAILGAAIPLFLIAFGQDYFDPRNVIGALFLATCAAGALIGLAARPLLAAVSVCAFLAISVAIDLDPRLQRGDWRGVAAVLAAAQRHLGGGPLVINTVHLGTAPLQYYLGAKPLQAAASARLLVQVGYAPLAPNPTAPPLPGFDLVRATAVHGIDLYLFAAAKPVALQRRELAARTITPSAGPAEPLLYLPPAR